MAKYCLLKGKVSYLAIQKVEEENTDDQSKNQDRGIYLDPSQYSFPELIIGFIIETLGGFLLFILTICKFFLEIFFSVFNFRLLQIKLLKGTYFSCYIGNVKAEGKLKQITFKDGDYVEMIVKPTKKNQYYVYAVRIPKYHALFFPVGAGSTTLTLLKYCAFGVGIFAALMLVILLCCQICLGYTSFIELMNLVEIITSIYIFIVLFIFFSVGGRLTFMSNRIYATLGYPKSWAHNSDKETDAFIKLNRNNDPILYNDPQSPDFEKVKKKEPSAYYYCRTPKVPSWVTIIDER